MDKLRGCPFCGGEASYEYSYDNYNHDCIVCHNNECGASLTCWPYEGEKVTAAWNRRAQPEVVPTFQAQPNKPLTNADRIRGMTDKELADLLCTADWCEACDQLLGSGICQALEQDGPLNKHCAAAGLRWLQQTVEDSNA